jgi:hypothetical protein
MLSFIVIAGLFLYLYSYIIGDRENEGDSS